MQVATLSSAVVMETFTASAGALHFVTSPPKHLQMA
jgi:hypothetical protein